jgi:hypothetical protein
MRLLLGVCLLALAGCGSGGGGAELPVSGVVTLDGNPVANALVGFSPDEGIDQTSSGFARTGSDGKFVVTGSGGKKGLVPGRYKVTVSKGQANTSGQMDDTTGAVVEADIKDEFPPIYSDPTRTVLAFSVTGDGKPIEIKLDSKRKK